MKKIFFSILCIVLLFGCQKEDMTYYDQYLNIKDQLLNQEIFDDDYNFNIRVIYNFIDQEYRYDVIIDEPTETMYNLVVLSYVDEDDDEMCPNLGIFDYDSYHLIPNFIDKDNNYYKGVQVSGMCQDDTLVKVYVSYFLDEALTQKVEKYIEVENSEIR